MSCLPGDLNCDQAVDGMDVQLWIEVFWGKELHSEIISRADVNGDHLLNVLDLQAIIANISTRSF